MLCAMNGREKVALSMLFRFTDRNGPSTYTGRDIWMQFALDLADPGYTPKGKLYVLTTLTKTKGWETFDTGQMSMLEIAENSNPDLYTLVKLLPLPCKVKMEIGRITVEPLDSQLNPILGHPPLFIPKEHHLNVYCPNQSTEEVEDKETYPDIAIPEHVVKPRE